MRKSWVTPCVGPHAGRQASELVLIRLPGTRSIPASSSAAPVDRVADPPARDGDNCVKHHAGKPERPARAERPQVLPHPCQTKEGVREDGAEQHVIGDWGTADVNFEIPSLTSRRRAWSGYTEPLWSPVLQTRTTSRFRGAAGIRLHRGGT